MATGKPDDMNALCTNGDKRPAGRFRAFLMVTALTAPVLLSSAAPSNAQEAIQTRGGFHPDYGRVVFDWPRQVDFQTELAGGALLVRFQEPVTTDFTNLLNILGAYVRSARLEDGGATVRLELAQPVTVNSFRSGNSIAVDLRPDSSADSAQTAQTETPVVPVRVGRHPTYTRIVFDWTEPTDYTVDLAGGVLTARFNRPARVDAAQLAGRLPRGFGPPQSAASSDEMVFVLPVAGGSTMRDLVAGDKVVFDITLGSGPVAEASAGATEILTPVTPPPEETETAETPTPETEAEVQEPEPETAEANTVELTPETAEEQTAGVETQSEAAQQPAEQPGTDQESPAVADSGVAAADEGPVSLAPPLDDAEAEAEAEARRILEEEDAAAEEAAALAQAEAEASATTEGIEPEETPESDPATTGDSLQTRVRTAGDDVQGPRTAEQLAVQRALEEGTVQFKRDDSGRAVSADGPAPVSFSFDWPEEVGAAVYRRGEYVWVVFDRRAPIDLNPLRQQGAPLIDRIEQLPLNNATALRLRTKPEVHPVVRLEGFNWVVDFRTEPYAPQNQVEIRAEADADAGPKLIFPTANPGGLVTIPDPDVGDTLLVATYRESGTGVAGTRVYPEFRVLSSAQGVVVESNGDEVLFERSFDGFAVSGTDGLHISAVSPEAPASTAQNYSARRLFNFQEWVRGGEGDYLPSEYKLLQAVTEVPEDSRMDARLDMVRFYAARHRGPEANGIMQVIERLDESIFKKADLRALRGAVRVLNNDLEAARQDLSDPRLDGFAEAALWRGAVLAELGDMKGAADQFRVGDTLLRDYPYPLKAYLGLLRVEAAIATQDRRSASRWLDELDSDVELLTRGQYSRLRFHQGQIAFTQNDLELAYDYWTELVEGSDPKYAARAEFLLINMQRRQNEIDDDEVVERLERLRFQWRGDGFEFRVLRRLGQSYIDKGDYLNGLTTWRLAVTYFAEEDSARELAEDMTDLFRRLYIDGEADRMPPLRALALYDEFRELTPAGADGDLLIELLANRLIDVDLLDRASALLDQQIEFRLKEQGREKARIGTKLAFVRLLNSDPIGAVDALRKTNFPQIDRELDDDRRRLEAKAMFELDRDEEAVKLLAGDTSIDADILRQDIFRKGENWTEAAKVLQRLSGDPPEEDQEINEENARHVVNWAVALKLDKDEAGLAQVRELYGPAMNLSAFRDVFNYIVAPNEEGGANLQASLQQLAANDGFNAFMENYRDRLLTPVLGSEDSAPVTSGTNSLQDS